MINQLLDEHHYSNEIIEYINSLERVKFVEIPLGSNLGEMISVILYPNLLLKGDQVKNGGELIKRGDGYYYLKNKVINPETDLNYQRKYINSLFFRILNEDNKGVMTDIISEPSSLDQFLLNFQVQEEALNHTRLGIEKFLETKDLFYLDLVGDAGPNQLSKLLLSQDISYYHPFIKSIMRKES